MGIRDEIEQSLQDSQGAFEHSKDRVKVGNTSFKDKVKRYAGEVSGLRIALSLLNEWECFGETIIKEGASPRECGKLVHDFIYGAFLSEYDKMIAPGDHIIIYVRRAR